MWHIHALLWLEDVATARPGDGMVTTATSWNVPGDGEANGGVLQHGGGRRQLERGSDGVTRHEEDE